MCIRDRAYRYRHAYASEKMDMDQQILEKNTGVLIIRELPDTVKLKETEAEAYSAVWDLMIKLEKSLPMAYIFYGQDSLVEENTRYDEIGIFLPDSLFLKNLELSLIHISVRTPSAPEDHRTCRILPHLKNMPVS